MAENAYKSVITGEIIFPCITKQRYIEDDITYARNSPRPASEAKLTCFVELV
jgi:hypothetical protein